MFVTWPVSFILLYNNINNSYIFLFGDEHESLSFKCNNKYINIWVLFNNIFKKNILKNFDLYIETYQIKDDKYKTILNEDSIEKIIKTFYDAFSINKIKIKEKYPNVLFHYIDYRMMIHHDFIHDKYHIKYKNAYSFFNDVEIIDELLLDILNRKIINSYNLNLIHKFQKLKNIFIDHKLYDLNINTYINLFIEYIHFSKISKQYSKIKNKKIVNILNEYTITYLKNIQKKFFKLNFNKVYDIINDYINHKNITNEKYNILLNYYEMNFLTQFLLVDLYGIARLFITNIDKDRVDDHLKTEQLTNEKLDMKELSSNFISTQSPINYKIIYIGQNHANNFINILKKIDYKIIYQGKAIKKRCIYIDDNIFHKIKISL